MKQPPYRHPITTSWERPELPGIEVNAPHWYAGTNTKLTCDRETAGHAANWKRFHKPVIVGEQGNSASKEQLQLPGIGGVWDLGSSTRMRIRNWVALFNEISFIFWNTSYAKDGHSMNIWLGPQERQYVHAMQDFACRLDNNVRMTPEKLSMPDTVRSWGLISQERAAVYHHHFENHTNAVTNLSLTINVPRRLKGYWIGDNFDADIDADGRGDDKNGNGIADYDEMDFYGDGVPKAKAVPWDAFPLDPEESRDTDGDGIGDNRDPNKDGDGWSDDEERRAGTDLLNRFSFPLS